jgi:hypothetical protein
MKWLGVVLLVAGGVLWGLMFVGLGLLPLTPGFTMFTVRTFATMLWVREWMSTFHISEGS